MKLKDILYKNYSDLKSYEKRFYTINQEKFEINSCNKCTFIDSTYDLNWDTFADLKGWTCLCDDCFYELGGEYYA